MNSKPVNYKEAVEYIESIPKFTQKHTQEHTREFLERLGRPAFDRKVVHVAGTNGKKTKKKQISKKIYKTYAKKASITLRGDCTGFCFIGRKNYIHQCF